MRRATIIGEQIYERAAPIPDVTPSPDRNSFLHEVAALVDRVCAEGGGDACVTLLRSGIAIRPDRRMKISRNPFTAFDKRGRVA